MAGRNGSTRGFAGMDPERQREAASKGGKARSKNFNEQNMEKSQNSQSNQGRGR